MILQCFLFCHILAFSQAKQIFQFAKRDTIPSYCKDQATKRDSNQFSILLNMNFGESYIINTFDRDKLTSGKVVAVNLYYSNYPSGNDFAELNLARLEELFRYVPQLQDTTLEWNLIAQSDCKNLNAAKRLFHGFEVVLEYNKNLSLSSIEIDSSFKDFVVDRVLARNSWKDMLIVADMTGSMSPYIAQLFIWLKLNTIDDKVKQFLFFNDGDTKLTEDKLIGETGGFYYTKSNRYEDIEREAIRCFLSGDGGDETENDIEALLTGIELCPDCKEIILVADNNAPVRDLVLMKKLKKPIRVILCGATGKINPQFLDLARNTNGSIHLMEQDLLDLIRIKEGESIELYGTKYRHSPQKKLKLLFIDFPIFIILNQFAYKYLN